MADYPTYGDVLGRPADDPDRDQIKVTEDWTPVRLPGHPPMWRHWTEDGPVDLPHSRPPL